MTDLISKTAQTARWMVFVFFSLLGASVFCGTAEIGPADWLFQVSVKNRVGAPSADGRQLVMILPSACVLSMRDLDRYLAWGGEAHKSFAGALCSVWDVDDIELREPDNANLAERMSSFLRVGDSARDPSGVLSLAVADVSGGGAGTFKLCLAARPLAPEKASPDICLTNLWVLSREELFARWEKEIGDGMGGAVFDEMGRLGKSGRYRLPGGRAWEKAVRKFRLEHPALHPSIVFRNGSDKPICV